MPSLLWSRLCAFSPQIFQELLYVPIVVTHAPFWTHTQTRHASPVPLRLATLSSSATTRAGWDTHCQTSGVSATTGASSRSPTRANRTTRSSTLKSLQLHHPVNGGDVGAESGTPGLKAEDPVDAYPISHQVQGLHDLLWCRSSLMGGFVANFA